MVCRQECLKFDLLHLFTPPGHENNRNLILNLLRYGNVRTETI